MVIDHITGGRAFLVLRVMGLLGSNLIPSETISVVMNIDTKVVKKDGDGLICRMRKKDIIKIEDTYINQKDISKIGIISPNVTINLIQEYEVISKYVVTPPRVLKGVVRCNNSGCISRVDNEPLIPSSTLISTNPLLVRCNYCRRVQKESDILLNIFYRN